MNKILAILSILAVCIIVLTALEKTNELDDYEIKPIIDAETGNYTSVQFVEKVSKTVVSEFDIDNNNPYTKKFPLLKKGKNNHYLYDLSKININNLEIDQSEYVYKPDLNLIKFGSCGLLIFINDNYSVFNYTLKYLNATKEEVIAYSSYLYIYNSRGMLVKQIENSSEVMGRPVITENGKYLAYRFGGFLAGSGYTLAKAGYRIIDIEKDKTIIDLNLSDHYKNATPIAENNLIIIRLNGTNYKYLVYDFDKKRIYSRIYNENAMVKIKKITKDGFILGKKDMLDKETEFIPFSDFQITEW